MIKIPSPTNYNIAPHIKVVMILFDLFRCDGIDYISISSCRLPQVVILYYILFTLNEVQMTDYVETTYGSIEEALLWIDDFRAYTCTWSQEGFRTISVIRSTASDSWLLLKDKVNSVSSRETFTSIFPPTESINYSTFSFEYFEVPFKAPRAAKLDAELFANVSCLLPALTNTVILY